MTKRNNENGFTLIEVMISMAIMSVVGLALISIFQAASTSIAKTKSMNEQQMIVDSVVDVISDEIRYATDVTLCNTVVPDPQSSLKAMYINDNKIYMTNIDPTNEVLKLMLNHDMDIEFVYKSDYNITLKVSVTGKYGTTTLDTSVKLINCELKKDKIKRSNDTQSVFQSVLYQP